MVLFIASIALFAALIPGLPYGFFQLLRIFICGVSCYAILVSAESEKKAWIWIFVTIAVIFNPLIKIRFDREVWQVIDVISGITFLIAGVALKRHKPPIKRNVVATKPEPNHEPHRDKIDIVSEVYKQSGMPDSYCFWCERLTVFEQVSNVTVCKFCGYTKQYAITKAADRFHAKKEKEKTPMDSVGLEW